MDPSDYLTAILQRFPSARLTPSWLGWAAGFRPDLLPVLVTDIRPDGSEVHTLTACEVSHA